MMIFHQCPICQATRGLFFEERPDCWFYKCHSCEAEIKLPVNISEKMLSVLFAQRVPVFIPKEDL